MIIKNPDNGAEIKNFAAGGKVWYFPVGKVLEFEDLVGEELLNVYGFLEKIESLAPKVLETAKGFECSVCGHVSSARIGIVAHQKIHEIPVSEQATPVKDAPTKPGLMQARANKMAALVGESFPKIPGTQWTDTEYEERARARIPGHFGG